MKLLICWLKYVLKRFVATLMESYLTIITIINCVLFLFFPLLFQPCTKDDECCGKQLCVWGQCSQNATKGEAGSTCQYQTDCNPDLCCAFHKGTVEIIVCIVYVA